MTTCVYYNYRRADDSIRVSISNDLNLYIAKLTFDRGLDAHYYTNI